MGVESIEVDTVNLRMVARTLPGKQFEVGRRLRLLVVASLARDRDQRREVRSWCRGPSRHRCRGRGPTQGRCADEHRPPLTSREGRGLAQPTPSAVRMPPPRCSDHRLFLGVGWLLRDLPARRRPHAGADQRGGAAGLRPGPQLHLGAAYRRAATSHDDHDDGRPPDDGDTGSTGTPTSLAATTASPAPGTDAVVPGHQRPGVTATPAPASPTTASVPRASAPTPAVPRPRAVPTAADSRRPRRSRRNHRRRTPGYTGVP